MGPDLDHHNSPYYALGREAPRGHIDPEAPFRRPRCVLKEAEGKVQCSFITVTEAVSTIRVERPDFSLVLQVGLVLGGGGGGVDSLVGCLWPFGARLLCIDIVGGTSPIALDWRRPSLNCGCRQKASIALSIRRNGVSFFGRRHDRGRRAMNVTFPYLSFA
jgi:hypothetical protein